MSRSIKSQIKFQEDYVSHLKVHLTNRVAAGAMSLSSATSKIESAEAILDTLNKVLHLHPRQEATHG